MEFPLSYLEPREELLAVDPELTDAQLKGWRAAGILPSPVRKGLGRGRGVLSLYPGGSTDQVRQILKWKRWDRRLDVITWCLWVDPFTPLPPTQHTAADAVQRMIDRGIGLDVWSDVESSGRDEASESVRRAIRAYVARRLGVGRNAEVVANITHQLTTLNSEDSESWPEVDPKLESMVFQVLQPVIPGAKNLLTSRPSDLVRTLHRFVHERSEMLSPRFLPEWIRRTDPIEVRNVLWDIRVAHDAIEGAEAWSRGPPGLALMYLAIFVRSFGVTFDGIRDALWTLTDPIPTAPNDLLPYTGSETHADLTAIREFLHALAIKKSDS